MKKYLYYFIFIVTALVVVLNIFGHKFILFPEKEHSPLVLNFEEVSFKSEDGTAVNALYLPAADYMDTILFFHGNAGNVTYFQDFAATYAKHGFGVLVFDYRGFGKTKGRITQQGIYEDSAAALEYLIKERKLAPENIILWGYSFGNAPAVETAVKYNNLSFKALLLQSPFTNTPQMAGAILGGKYAPNSLFQRVVIGVFYLVFFDKRYDNLAKIENIKTPVFVSYTQQDSIIPWDMSEALFKAAPAGAKNYRSPIGKHSDFAWAEKDSLAFINGLE